MQQILPTDFLPEYFRQDLNIGEPTAHPIAEAIDSACWNILLESQKQTHSMHADYLSVNTKENILGYHGISARLLPDEKKHLLFAQLKELFKAQGKLSAIKMLADVFFDTTDVQRGRPYPRERLHVRQKPLALSDSRDALSTVFVRLHTAQSDELINDFIQSCKQLLPHGFNVLIAQPVKSVSPSKQPWSVGIPSRLDGRRL